MSKTINTNELKSQAEKPNIIYSESLEGLLPTELVNENTPIIKFSLRLSDKDYDLKLISIKKTKKGNICSFKLYNFNSVDFLYSNHCSILVEDKIHNAKLIKVCETEDHKDNANTIVVLLEV